MWQVCAVWTLPRCGGYAQVHKAYYGPCGDKRATWEGGASVCSPHPPQLQLLNPSSQSPVRAMWANGARWESTSHFYPMLPRGPNDFTWPTTHVEDSGVAAAMWEGPDCRHLPHSPTEPPYTHMACTRRGELGCSRRNV